MENLRLLREKKGLRQKDVAELIGVSQVAYSYYEKGSREPDYATLVKLSDFFGVSTDYLLGLDDTPYPDKSRRWIPLREAIKAGSPEEGDDYIVGYVEYPRNKYPDIDLQALIVKGDSMEPRIVSGDIVIYKPQSDAENGDIVIARVNGCEYTLKKIKKLENGIMLVPMNRKYEPMFYTFDQVKELPVEVVGVVVELRGQF